MALKREENKCCKALRHNNGALKKEDEREEHVIVSLVTGVQWRAPQWLELRRFLKFEMDGFV
nr:hypothetical protein Itr_chr05CG04730 [Ipomoea trifida]GMC93412.1 hypothetical protein Iba_chr05bCG2130 [Ipomoea batatas]